MNSNERKCLYFENVAPIKITEARFMKLHSGSWGLLSEFYLESVKINRLSTGRVTSSATMKVGDKSGQVVVVVKGSEIAPLFGLTPQQWTQVEMLCGCGQQLFYRYFKDGLSQNFSNEQKLFYNFCSTNQTTDVLVASFRRSVNHRNKDSSDPLLEIIKLRKCDTSILDLYVNALRKTNKELS